MANTWVGIVTEKLRLSIPVTEKKYIPNDAQGWTFALHPCLFSIFLFDAYPPVNSIGFVALLILEETVFVLNGTAVGLAKNAKFCRSE